MNSKIYGIIGSGFMSFSFIPNFSILFNILGLIFLGISINILNKNREFNYFLIASILTFIASILFYFKIVAIFTSLFLGLFSNNPLVPIGVSIIFYFLIYYILVIISAIYYKKSFSSLGNIYQNKFFNIGGIFLIIGSVLNLFLIGMVVFIIGWLLILIGFFTLENIIDVEIIEEEKFLPKN